MVPLVLVVDDDHEIRHLASDLLREAGYATIEAERASDALLQLEQNPTIELLFTDIMMPGINGFVLADMAVTRWPHLRVLYTSGLSDLRDAGPRAGHRHGALLAKPFRADALEAAISAALAQPPIN